MSEPIAAGLVLSTEIQKQNPKEAVLNKACDHCRALKVRCFPDLGSSSGICQWCARSKRTCTFAPPQKRKQRIRTDTRVVELGKEMRAMRSLLRLSIDGGNRAMEDIHTLLPITILH